MLHEINHKYDHSSRMMLIPLVVLLVFCLFPIGFSFAQSTDTAPTLVVKVTSTAPYSFKTSEGFTMILGEVENTGRFPVTNVQIFAGFYGTNGIQPLETVRGGTLLDVVPPYTKVPYAISSKSTKQGSIYVFIALVLTYALWMRRIDREHGVE